MRKIKLLAEHEMPTGNEELCIRFLEEIPFDKEFNGELCHSTGFEFFDGKEWWNEYEVSSGELHYGR